MVGMAKIAICFWIGLILSMSWYICDVECNINWTDGFWKQLVHRPCGDIISRWANESDIIGDLELSALEIIVGCVATPIVVFVFVKLVLEETR